VPAESHTSNPRTPEPPTVGMLSNTMSAVFDSAPLAAFAPTVMSCRA
jgi:hypothetical protein